MEVSVRELKNHLSEYLRRLESEGEISVTSRGRTVARLLPPAANRPMSDEEAMSRLRALPFIRPGNGGQVRGSDQPIRLEPGEKTLSEIVNEMRE